MKFTITIALSLVLYGSSSLLSIPWFSGFLILLLLGIPLGRHYSNSSVFMIGFYSTFISWTIAFGIGILTNGKVLLTRLGDIFSMNHYLLVVLTILTASIIGGLAAYTGAEIKLFKKRITIDDYKNKKNI